MAFGFQTQTTDGWRQLLDSYIYFRLEQKLVLDESGWEDTALVGAPELVRRRIIFINGLTMADRPQVAISCTTGTFATITAASGGVNITVYRIIRVSAATVTLYVMSKRPPPTTGFGLKLFNPAGTALFNLFVPIERPLGTYNNSGYAGVSLAGKQLAHIPQRFARGTIRSFRVGVLGSCTTTGTSGQPVQAYQSYYTDTTSCVFVACAGSSVSADGKTLVGPEQPYLCSISNTGTPGDTGSQATNYRSLIIDVTNI